MAQRVLLTGANGFVGSHILAQLLAQGSSVRSVVRSQAKADQVLADFPNYGSKLDFAIVPDLTAPGAFDQAVQSTPPFDTVIHTASPFLYRVAKDASDFLDPAIKGTLGVLKSVKANAPEVKRIVVTSSCAAVVDFTADPFASPQKVYTEDDWNPMTVEKALGGAENLNFFYQVSKKYAEKSAWDFLEQEKPNFDLVTITPPMIYGPLHHSVKSVKELNQSNGRIYDLFINSSKTADVPPNGMHVYTDVREVAEAHVKAATMPGASNQRFIVCAGRISSQNICDLLREAFPELSERTPEGKKGDAGLSPTAYTCSSERAMDTLGIQFRSPKETFVELAKQLLEIEKSS
ncbi:NAD(P)-binding protein-5 [Coleophoma crateriformis]|uniref:NAD(P)-binding protein-5 n=1 Tax=Coleophoma crateriformis TaxID=565419 RepID=A0A3D8QYB2_9HELO|nr:NAD(P)-binding protein-5 [Coleophoma crateriformis]